jgi:integrase/recombinase XerC/integrase/recombinase XerD
VPPGLLEPTDRWLNDRVTSSRRRISTNTADLYRADLAEWARYLVTGGSAADDMVVPGTVPAMERRRHIQDWWLARASIDLLTEDSLKSVLSSMARVHAPSTQRRRISALVNFCGWAVRHRLIEVDPTADLGASDTSGLLPVALSSHELARCIQVAASPPRDLPSAWPLRDVAIVRVLAGTGIRNAELCSLTTRSLDRENAPAKLRVLGKGNKERIVPTPASTVAAIDHYLADRASRAELTPSLSLTFGSALFVRSDGANLDPHFVDRLVTRVFSDAAVPAHVGEKAHRFRHAYAKGLLEAGMTLAEVQALLGHSNIRTTAIYTRLAAEGVLDAARLAPGADISSPLGDAGADALPGPPSRYPDPPKTAS